MSPGRGRGRFFTLPRERSELRKHEWERSVALPFVTFLRQEGVPLGNPKAGRPALDEPDFVCTSREGPTGIEVAAGYADTTTAERLWRQWREQALVPGSDFTQALTGTQDSA